MANEYKCDMCGKTASVHITKIVNGKKVKMHLCAECAEKANFKEIAFPPGLLPKIKELEESIKKGFAKAPLSNACPNCGSSLDEMKKGSIFCCPEAYAFLKDSLDDLLTQMHGATFHKGKTPKFHIPQNPAETLEKLIEGINLQEEPLLQNLVQSVQNSDTAPSIEPKTFSKKPEDSIRSELEKALSEERYEDAATLRDELKKLTEAQASKKQEAK